MELLCYANKNEKIHLSFHPCVNTGRNIAWEEWHAAEPLLIYATDYAMLLPCFMRVFPLINPANGEVQDAFDLCISNWIGREDWHRIIECMKSNVPSQENEVIFFNQLLNWLEAQLSWADMIVVDGNL